MMILLRKLLIIFSIISSLGWLQLYNYQTIIDTLESFHCQKDIDISHQQERMLLL